MLVREARNNGNINSGKLVASGQFLSTGSELALKEDKTLFSDVIISLCLQGKKHLD